MSNDIIILMLSVSIFLGFFGVMAFSWGVKSGQFDDEKKFTKGLLFDGEEELNEAIEMEKIEKNVKKGDKKKNDKK